jgi:hypothetical protein
LNVGLRARGLPRQQSIAESSKQLRLNRKHLDTSGEAERVFYIPPLSNPVVGTCVLPASSARHQ